MSARNGMLGATIKAIVAHLIWAGNAVAASGALKEMGPWSINVSRWTLALLLLIPMVLFERKPWPRLGVRQWVLLVVAGCSGIFLFNTLMYKALVYGSVINNSLIYGATPVITLLLSSLYLREQTRPVQWMGVLISLIGVAWIVSRGSLAVLLSLKLNVGDLFSLAAASMWSVYSVAGKKLADHLTTLQALTLLAAIGLVGLWPTAWLETGHFPLAGLSGGVWVALVYLGIFASIVAFVFWMQIVEQLGAARSAPYGNLLPLFGVLVGILFFKEPFQLSQLLGGLLVVAGIFLVVSPGAQPLWSKQGGAA